MFSKHLRLYSLIWILAITGGCELPLNESPPDAKPIEVSLGDTAGCLSRVVPVVELYFQGEAQDSQVQATWECMSKAVTTFEESVQGRYEDRFTRREVAHFIEQYFLEDGSRMPDELTTEIFRIKQLYVGGVIESISRTEMKNLNQVIHEMKRITLGLNPYMKILTFNWEPDATRDLDHQHFEGANQQVQIAAKDLAILIEKNGMPYRLEYVTRLIRNFQDFNDSSWSWVTDVEKTIPLVQKLKKALAGGSEDEIAPSEWHRFVLLGGRGYIQYLRYYYFVKSRDLSQGGRLLTYFFMTSISDLFSYLGDMVESKPGQKLTRDELVEILQAMEPLVPDLKVSDELVLEIMRIKVVFFGGREDFFVKADFVRAQDKLDSFRVLTEKFLKYSDVYGLSWKPGSLPVGRIQAHFNQAENTLIEVAQGLGENMEDRYDLNNLIALAEEIDKLYSPTAPDKKGWARTAIRFLPMVISVKNILFNDYPSSAVGVAHSSISSKVQWQDFMSLIAKVYARYLSYRYFVEDHSVFQGVGLTGLDDLVRKTLLMVDDLIDRKQAGQISFIEINRLWGAVLKGEILPKKITAQTLDSMTKILLQRFLVSPEDRLTGNVPQGLSKISTKALGDEFSLWAANQDLLDLIYAHVADPIGKSSDDILAELSTVRPGVVAYEELKIVFQSPLPMSFDEQGRWYLSKPAKNYLRQTANLVNLIRAVVRLVTRGYGTESSRIRNYDGLTLEEINVMYVDLKPLVVELNLLHPTDTEFANNRFRDANLFTPLGNGDGLASFREINQLFLMIFSGLKIDSMMFEKMTDPNHSDVCIVEKPTDYKDDWLSDLDCVIKFYQKEMPIPYSSMPDFAKYMESIRADDAKFKSMFMNLLKSAGHIEVPGETKVHIGDLALVPHVSQYIEGLFQGYETNRDSILQTEEAMMAYPIYRDILAQVSGLKTEKELRGLFGWMLKKGKPPQTTIEKFQFTAWSQKKESTWLVDADRERLASILGFIAEAMENAKKAEEAQGEDPKTEEPKVEDPKVADPKVDLEDLN